VAEYVVLDRVVFDRVTKTISRYSMLPRGSRVITAVSGGPDSVCLLHVLAELAPQMGLQVEVAHLNHQLRGAESDADELFVKQLAAERGLRFHVARSNVAAIDGNLEQAARRARLEFFQSLVRGDDVVRTTPVRIATGHTRDDQAETVMLRILRGSGLSGLAGIHPVTETQLIRPLLDISRAEIVDHLRARGIAWREDSSNRNLQFARNRMRHELLPQLKTEWNPQLAEALAQLADLSWEEERWWHSPASPLNKSPLHHIQRECVAGGVEMDVRTLAILPRAIERRAIRGAISTVKGNLRGVEFEHVERVIDLAAQENGDGRIQLPGVDVRRSFDWIRLARPTVVAAMECGELEIPGTCVAPDGKSLIQLEIVPGELPCANLKAEVLGLSRIVSDVRLRGWRPGDRYRPVGERRVRKLKDMFSAARIPSWQRRYWPMVMSGQTIIWSREFGVAADFAAEGHVGPFLRISEVKSHGNESFERQISS
jgi:tRNA(Ile)-lysidine synthase